MDMEILFSGGKRVDAVYNGFTIRTDQCVKDGGEGAEPEPFDLFFASLGTCAGVYVLYFCQFHDLPWEGISLRQTAERDPETNLFQELRIEIRVPESFPAKYHKALIRSASQCTVKKHIAKGLPEFVVSVVTEKDDEG